MIISLFSAGCGNKAATSSTEDNSLEEIKSKGVFVVGLDDTFAPMGFRDEAGEIVGFDIDLAKEVAKRMGVEIELKPIDWNAKMMELNGKNIDVIWNGLSITEERKKEILFSDVYLDNKQIIIVEAIRYSDQSRFSHKVIGLQTEAVQGSPNADADTTASIKVSDYPDNTTVLMELEAGRLDAAVMDEIVGRYYIAKSLTNLEY